jgi:hypothetical protein
LVTELFGLQQIFSTEWQEKIVSEQNERDIPDWIINAAVVAAVSLQIALGAFLCYLD